MFGNIFWNWQKDSTGKVITPNVDVGLPISEVHVRYLGVDKTLADASTAGWISSYAWRFDATQHQYVLVSATQAGAERALMAWSGYWIRTTVNCQLVINPITTYNGAAVGASSVESVPSCRIGEAATATCASLCLAGSGGAAGASRLDPVGW